ncbi:unnamed protein product [Boreogadus saida]
MDVSDVFVDGGILTSWSFWTTDLEAVMGQGLGKAGALVHFTRAINSWGQCTAQTAILPAGRCHSPASIGGIRAASQRITVHHHRGSRCIISPGTRRDCCCIMIHDTGYSTK